MKSVLPDQLESENELPVRTELETEPLPGVIIEQYVRCGNKTCRCMNSDFRHGPYSYRVWREAGEVQKVYIKKSDLARVRASCAAHRLLKHPSFAPQPNAGEAEAGGGGHEG